MIFVCGKQKTTTKYFGVGKAIRNARSCMRRCVRVCEYEYEYGVVQWLPLCLFFLSLFAFTFSLAVDLSLVPVVVDRQYAAKCSLSQ